MTIRKTLLKALVARIDALPGWTVGLRGTENAVAGPVHAIVVQDGEDKTIANSQSYNATLRVSVVVMVRAEDADETLDDGNAFLYLDRKMSEIENVLHDPDAWGVNPGFTEVRCVGHEVADPSDANELMARVLVRFTYRHDYQDSGL